MTATATSRGTATATVTMGLSRYHDQLCFFAGERARRHGLSIQLTSSWTRNEAIQKMGNRRTNKQATETQKKSHTLQEIDAIVKHVSSHALRCSLPGYSPSPCCLSYPKPGVLACNQVLSLISHIGSITNLILVKKSPAVIMRFSAIADPAQKHYRSSHLLNFFGPMMGAS